jgi:tRNA nucleotidyltransferase/poly(A) polymerase
VTAGAALPDWPPLVAQIQARLPAEVSAWLVGGAVRDALLGRRLHDLDLAVTGDGLALARAVADSLGAPYFPLDSERRVGRVILAGDDQPLTVDFASLRGPDLQADLADRDFTINAMAAALTQPEALIDPLGGYPDLRQRLLRACGPGSLAHDPLRGLRAVRLAAELNFRLEPATREQVRAQAARLADVAWERRRDELLRCLGGPRPTAALRALAALGLLDHTLPELAAVRTADAETWERAVAVTGRLRDLLSVLGPVHDVDAASDLTLGLVSLRLGRHRQALSQHLQTPLADDRPARWLLMLAAALHPVSDLAAAAQRLTTLRLSSDEVRRVRDTLAAYPRLGTLADGPAVTRRDVYRYFHAAGPAGVEGVLLALAAALGVHGDQPPPADDWNRLLDVAVALLRGWYEEPEAVVRPAPLLTGRDVMQAFDLPPGPRLGEVLDALREAQAAGEVPDREAALAFVQARLAE